MPKGAKYGGRQKGTPNKVTQNLRAFIQRLLEDNEQRIIEDLKNVDSKDRLMIYERLLQYVVPKQSNVKTSIDFDKLTDTEIDNIIDKLKEIDDE